MEAGGLSPPVSVEEETLSWHEIHVLLDVMVKGQFALEARDKRILQKRGDITDAIGLEERALIQAGVDASALLKRRGGFRSGVLMRHFLRRLEVRREIPIPQELNEEEESEEEESEDDSQLMDDDTVTSVSEDEPEMDEDSDPEVDQENVDPQLNPTFHSRSPA